MGFFCMVFSKLVIVVISGYVVVGGFELVLWCDLCIVEEDAVLGVFCWCWGVLLIDGGIVRFFCIVGFGCVLDFIFMGCVVGVCEVFGMGFVNCVVFLG